MVGIHYIYIYIFVICLSFLTLSGDTESTLLLVRSPRPMSFLLVISISYNLYQKHFKLRAVQCRDHR